MEASDQLHAPTDLPQIGDWMGSRTGLDEVTKTKRPSSCLDSNPDCPFLPY